MRARDFLTREEKDRVTEQIRAAERLSSGEIRIHIENSCKEDPRENALRSFKLLEMDKTSLRNGVLVYVACVSRKFAVIGDKGINEKVPHGFWNDVCDLLGDCFSREEYAAGLSEAVGMIGQKLSSYFPYRADDRNELPDEISIEDNDV